jgi:hypothetical protein
MSSDIGQFGSKPVKRYAPGDRPPTPSIEWHFSRLSGKLDGLYSITTSCIDAPFCRAQRLRGVDDDVCTHCYAATSLSTFRMNAREAMERNRRKLNEAQFEPPRRWPAMIALRFMSHGDISSTRELRSVYLLAERAPAGLPIALWTKNVDAVRDFCDPPPRRLKMIYSSPKIGIESAIPFRFDAVFTVYRVAEDIPQGAYRCEGRCADCLECYSMTGSKRIATVLHR